MDSPDQSFFSKVLPFLQGFDQLGLIVAFCALCDFHLSKAKQFRKEIRVIQRSDYYTPIRQTRQEGKEEAVSLSWPADHYRPYTILTLLQQLHRYCPYTRTVLTLIQQLHHYRFLHYYRSYIVTVVTLIYSLHYYSSYIVTVLTLLQSSHCYSPYTITVVTLIYSLHYYSSYTVTALTLLQQLYRCCPYTITVTTLLQFLHYYGNPLLHCALVIHYTPLFLRRVQTVHCNRGIFHSNHLPKVSIYTQIQVF